MNAGCIFLIVVAILICLILIFKLHLKLSVGWDSSPTCLIGKTAMVTGANTGIGFYTAQDFAMRGARVILACRDPIKAEEARLRIIEQTGNPNVVVKILDFASLSAVRKFAIEIKTTEERLDILVNNAGAGGLEHIITPDGLSLLMQTNYFGPFLLTILLLGLLKRSAPSRIVNVSSSVAALAKLNLEDLNGVPRGFSPKSIEYANSKLCNILFTNELARKLKGSGVDTNSLNPGPVQTEFLKNVPPSSRRVIYAIVKMFYKTVSEGSQTSIYVACSKDIEGVSGEYFSNCKKSKMFKSAQDQDMARRLWEKSEGYVRLTAEEKYFL